MRFLAWLYWFPGWPLVLWPLAAALMVATAVWRTPEDAARPGLFLSWVASMALATAATLRRERF